MYSRQKLWNKIDYRNCASRWSLTHCNMMHGTHNVTLTHCNMMHGTHNVTLIHCNTMHGTHNVKNCCLERGSVDWCTQEVHVVKCDTDWSAMVQFVQYIRKLNGSMDPSMGDDFTFSSPETSRFPQHRINPRTRTNITSQVPKFRGI